jgi:hypothetical protein
MLELIKQSGCIASEGNLQQLLFYGRTDVNYRTLSQFQPSMAFANPDKLEVPMERIGEHESYLSDKESGALSSDSEDQQTATRSGDQNVKMVGKRRKRKDKLVEQEFDQLAKRSYMVRRGRNNRLMIRPIH